MGDQHALRPRHRYFTSASLCFGQRRFLFRRIVFTLAVSAKSSVAFIALAVSLLAGASAPLAPLFDPDEGYYPATAAETLRSGTFWDLSFNGEPRWDKPILSYALIEASFVAFGQSATAARIPSAIEAGLLILIVGALVGRLAGDRAAVVSALTVGTTLGISIFSRAAHPELAVVVCVIATELLICVWLSTSDSRVQRRVAIAAGVAMGLGLLAKGPVAVALPLLTLVCMSPLIRWDADRVRSLVRDASLSVGIAIVLASPWFLAMTVRHGGEFVREAIWQQNVGRYATAAFGHRSGMFALVPPVLIGLFPWVLFLPQTLARVTRPRGRPREVLRAGMSTGALVALVFYSLSSSKLASYSLVCVPALAIVVGLWLDEQLDRPSEPRPRLQVLAVLGVLATALLSAPLWLGKVVSARQLFGAMRPQSADISGLVAPVTIALGCLMACSLVPFALTRRVKTHIAALACVGALAPVFVLAIARPLLHEMYPWDILGRAIAPGHGRAWVLARRAPSLTFYSQQQVTTVPDRATLAEHIVREPEGWIALTRDDWTVLSETPALKNVRMVVVAEHGRILVVHFMS